MTASLHIIVNGEPVRVAETSLEEALQALGYDLRHAAVAVNEELVHRQQRADTVLRDGDRVEVVSPMAGG